MIRISRDYPSYIMNIRSTARAHSIRFESKSNLKKKLKEEGYTIRGKGKKAIKVAITTSVPSIVPSPFYP